MDCQTCSRARSLYLNGDQRTAVQLVEQSLEQDPDDGEAWELLGTMRHGQKLLPEALQALETATSLQPLSLGGQLAIADCYARLGHRETAFAVFVHLADRDNLPSRYLADVAMGLGRLGDFNRALKLAREGAHRDPFCDNAAYAVAYYMSKCGCPGEVILPVLLKVVQLAPDVTIYQVALANLYHQIGRVDDAFSVLSRLSPQQLYALGCRDCLCRIASLFEERGDTVRREACLSRLEELESK